MSQRLASGLVLAGRYELADLQSERLGSSNWRAVDRVLHRNVRVELLPSTDPRAEQFILAAQQSTSVTDPRFLQVLDVLEDAHGHHVVVREWARAMTLSDVLSQSPLPNRRAAAIIAEVAEAMASAHELGQYHRRLTPHQILLKESGAVRIVGLGVATSLAPADTTESAADREHFERLDVIAIGKLLYACLSSRWPGAHVDGLRAAPTEHGHLLAPRQVRAGVARDVDAVCDRILNAEPRTGPPLRHASDIAHVLRLAGEDIEDDGGPATGTSSSPDLLRLDPVIVPSGPPPGLEPPRRRPKAFEPPPPGRRERALATLRESTHGDRALVLAGFLGVITIALVILVVSLITDSQSGEFDASRPVEPLPVDRVIDFDPLGGDDEENPDLLRYAIDDDPTTGWQTALYLNNPRLGGLKDGVGLIIDLGAPRSVSQIEIRFAGTPTDAAIFTAPSTLADVPGLGDLTQKVRIQNAGEDVVAALPDGTLTRYVVLWLRSLPEVADNKYRAEVRDIVVQGR